MPTPDYLRLLLELYYPADYFALFRAHELYNVEPFISQLEPPILDLGCGNGLIAQYLFGKQLEYGIDMDRQALKGAQESHAYKSTMLCDAKHIPLQSASVKSVFSNCVLEHISDLRTALGEVSRLLQPDGIFLATCLAPSYYDLNPVFRGLDNTLMQPLRSHMIAAENRLHNHVSVFSRDEYASMFADMGMTLEHHQYYAPPNLTNEYSKWDTLSKYRYPGQGKLTHDGLMVYGRLVLSKLQNRKHNIERMWQRYQSLCYQRPPTVKHTIGAAQIVLARKVA
jgi:ubiquinone/menaquinone biosynthesis C-methylase UbiE